MQADSLLAPYPPEDLQQFWAEIGATATDAPLDFSTAERSAEEQEHHRIDVLEFRGVEGMPLSAWIAIPHELDTRAPGFLWLPPYGRESTLPNRYSTRPGFVSLSFNFHGYGAFYQTRYSPHEGYFAQGIEDPHTWVFRTMAQNALLACRVLEAQLEADEDRIAVAGLSQGGGIALWVAAVSPIVKCAVADLPFLSCMNYVFSKPVHRYPLKETTDFASQIPLGLARIQYTMSYFDTVNVATLVKIPALMSYGLKDPACRPEAAKAVYEALRGPKSLVEYPGGHDWAPGMIVANLNWMKNWLNVSP